MDTLTINVLPILTGAELSGAARRSPHVDEMTQRILDRKDPAEKGPLPLTSE